MSEQTVDLSTLDASGLADRLGSLRRFVCRSSPTRHPLPLRGFGLFGPRSHGASND